MRRRLHSRGLPRAVVVHRGQLFPLYLTAGDGSYVTTGYDSTWTVEVLGAFFLAAGEGSYVLTGQDAVLRRAALFGASAGSYALTGQDAVFLRAARLVADAGTHVLVGQDAQLSGALRMLADAGTYVLTGQDTNFDVSVRLFAESGAHVLTGQDALFVRTLRMLADTGDHALAGQDALLSYAKMFAADAGAYATAGQDAGALRDYVLAADAGAHVLAGQDALLVRALRMPANAGAYTLAGQDTGFRRALRMPADAGAHVLAGQDAGFRRTLRMPASAGAYTLAGQTALLKRALRLDAAAGAHVLTGQDATLTFAGGAGLTFKGRGHIQVASSTGWTLNYDTVDEGSAPSAGDLAVWFSRGGDNPGNAFTTISGWQSSISAKDGSISVAAYAKVLTAGDISSPPNPFDTIPLDASGFWVVFSVTGTISTLTVTGATFEDSGAGTPASQAQNSSALTDPDVGITLGVGSRTGSTVTLAFTGSTIIDTELFQHTIGASAYDKYGWSMDVGGANVTVSKSDDGQANMLGSARVHVEFA